MSDELDPALPRTLQIISGAMGLGIVLLCGVVGATYFQSAHPATPDGVRVVNMFTAVAMGLTVIAIIASEILWKVLLTRRGARPLSQVVTGAFIVRLACREGAALAGCVAALLAAMGGVLRAYPAYWANLAPAFLFWSYIYLHWPSADNLKAEISATVGS